ncbi:hypothetical protein JCM8208_001814 [Rhodotorula glutinis]
MLPAAPPPPDERARPPPLPPKNQRGRELGLLVAVVDRARNLDCSSTDAVAPPPPPPFVELALTGSVDPKTRTRVDDRGRGEAPVWDEEFRFRLFEVDGSARQHLVVKVKRRGHDEVDEVELVGEARIVVDGTWDHFDQWVTLKRDGKYRGEIYLELTFYKPEQPPARQSVEIARPAPAAHHSSPSVLVGTPALAQQLGQMAVHDPPPPALDEAHRRTSPEEHAPLPLPGEPDSPHLPASLRPGRPTRQAPPRPPAVETPAHEHAHVYAAGRLPSPGAASVVGLSGPGARPETAPWSATPSQHAASYPPPRVASAAPAIAVSQPTLLTASSYPAPAQHHAPGFAAPRLSSTPAGQFPSPHASTSPHPPHQPQTGIHLPSHSPAQPYYASPEPSPPFGVPPSSTTFFPSSSLPPRSPSPSPSRPPVPPRPSSAASVASLSRMPGAMPASPPLATSTSPAPFDLASATSPAPVLPPLDHRRSSLSPHPAAHPAEHRPPSAASRPLPPNPSGDIRPSPTPSLDSKHREASSSTPHELYEPPPTSYASDATGSSVTLTPRRAAAEAQSEAERREGERRARIIEEQRGRMDEERRRAEEARRRSEAEEVRRGAEEEAQRARRREEDEARRYREQEAADRRRHEAERQRTSHEEASQRAARIERERLAQVEAAQRVRAARRAQEEEDARMAAQLADEAEQAERQREAERRAADEEAVRRLLDEERAAAALAQREREREDEEFARRFREEERRREAEERGERERADEALARRLREEEDAERQRALVEDERIARSLAEQQGERRTRAEPARS